MKVDDPITDVLVNEKLEELINELVTFSPELMIRIKIDNKFVILPSKKTAWKTVGHAKSALRHAVTGELYYKIRLVLGNSGSCNIREYIENWYADFLASGRVRFISVQDNPSIDITEGVWKVHPLDKRCVVDINDNVIADVRTWRDTNDAKAIARVPDMLGILEGFSGSSGNWADSWLNEIATKCDSILFDIKN